MKKLIGIIVVFVVVIAGLVICLATRGPGSPVSGTNPSAPPPKPPEPVEIMPVQPTPIRLVYPSNSLITGHLGETLYHTNILEKNKLIGDFQRMETEEQMLPSLNSLRFDAVFLSDITCLRVLANDFNGLILAYLGALGQCALLVPSDSSLKTIKDLANMSVGVTFGTSAHYRLSGWLKRGGLEPVKNVTLINLSPAELEPALLQGKVKAVAIDDPEKSQLVRAHNLAIIQDDPSYGVALISKDYWQKSPEAVHAFIRSIKEAFFFLANHKDEADQWLGIISKTPPELIRTCANINLNYSLRGKIDKVHIGLTDVFIGILSDCARFNYEAKLAPRLVNINSHLEPKLLEESNRVIDPIRYDPNRVKIIK